MKRASIIIGAGFGDEGKGLSTQYLCRQDPGALVVRFSGGHQVGHTVSDPEGKLHVFSNYGSGTFLGNPTFWSSYCTLNPTGIRKEGKALAKNGIVPKLILDPAAMITTPFDIAWNRALEKINLHGSVGVGFGATVERNEGPDKFHALDIQLEAKLHQRLANIDHYYRIKAKRDGRKQLMKVYLDELEKIDWEAFLEDIAWMQEHVTIRSEWEVFKAFDAFVFEGSQGILLDQDHGFFPHVTRAYTSSRNAMEMIQKYEIADPSLYYITRAYQTRHGNGPMTNNAFELDLINTGSETNSLNDWQGQFRKTVLDLDLLEHALAIDAIYAKGAKKHLMVTCLDQIPGEIRATKGGELMHFKQPEAWIKKGLLKGFSPESLLKCYGPEGLEIKISNPNQRRFRTAS